MLSFMEKVDYLIVGYGIASVCFAKHCIDNGRSFKIIADFEKSASHVAAGLVNPIVLHRFNPVNDAVNQVEKLYETFSDFEKLLEVKVIHKKPVYRIFTNEKETKTWQKKIQKNEVLQKYLNPEILDVQFKNIEAPFGFGEVYNTGWIDMNVILNNFYLKYKDCFVKEFFDHSLLDIKDNSYKNLQAQNIVFAEGIKVKQNPFFSFIPIKPNKGETLIIETTADLPDISFKSKNFLMPYGNNKYYVGATYNREWETNQPTQENRTLLTEKLEAYFKGDYTILEHRVAFRPTTPDRRGIIGEHALHKQLFILNGMGTRGTFHAPTLSQYLFDFIEHQKAIPEEHNVCRFYDLEN